jgi:Na+:H+ antiporter, NhaA family
MMPPSEFPRTPVAFPKAQLKPLTSPVALGIVAGLVVGKQVGITLFAWLAVKSGVSELPRGIRWRQIYAIPTNQPTRFTRSLFISDFAFPDSQLVGTVNLGILATSLIAGVVGWLILRGASSPR